MSNIKFILNFLKNPIRNASIFPSSRFLAKQMINWINFDNINSIIELWPWIWSFTKYIISNAKPETKIIVIELEKSYINILERKFWNRIIVENNSAHLYDEIAKKHKIWKIDLIISGLWIISLPESIRKSLMEKLRKDTKNWTIFRAFTYLPKIFNNTLKDYQWIKTWKTFLNFPPAHVYELNK